MTALDRVVVQKVGKRFASERALAGVSLELRANSMCAVLGHNGAGKTTLVGIVSTLVRPTDGKVSYETGGKPVTDDIVVRREIGLLAHQSLCYGELTATENLAFVAGMYGVDRSAARLTALLDQVGLDPRARDRAARTYSRGMLQRLGRAGGVVPKPLALLLPRPIARLCPA